ncbi:MAG: cyanophycin synthetase [Candidatus Vogelbacteria bacterium]|nr:cyanophycin synthetase [Candidatus Vogelbacteria bacterium]
MAQSTVAKILKKVSGDVGCKIVLEPKFGMAGQIRFSDGRVFYFKNTTIDINSFASSEIARDKDYTKYFLSKMGHRVPRGKAFFSDHWCEVNKTKNNLASAIKYAKKIKLPVIVKPNSRSQGEDVYNISNPERLEKILKRLFGRNDIVLIEEYIKGKDYRIIVLDGKVKIAYEREPLSIIGDGRRSVEELFDRRIKRLKRLRKIDIVFSDSRIRERLKNCYKISKSFIPKMGQKIILLDNANLSSGGEGIDVSEIIHEDYKKMAVDITRGMNLKLAGVDLLISGDISKPIRNKGDIPTCLEVNSSPGLSHYQTLGKEAKKRVKDLYLEILKSLKKVEVEPPEKTSA